MSIPATPAIQQLVGSIVDQAGVLKNVPYQYFAAENALLAAVSAAVNAVLGVNALTLVQAQALSLGVSDAGYTAFITDYGHTIRWSGTAWVFLDGGGGFFQDFPVSPQGTGWQLCDGTATNYLVVGATLTVSAFTTPDLTTGAYRKGGAYTGSVVAAVAPGASAVMSGATATGTTGTGTTGTGTTGTGTTGTPSGIIQMQPPVTDNQTVARDDHTHSVPGLSVPGLSIPGLSIPALDVGTLAAAITVDDTGEPAVVVVPCYFRR